MSCTLLLIVYYVSTFRHYLTSSKINTIDYQIYKYLMVQIWLIKFIKSILDVISMMFSSIFNCFKI